GWKRCGLRKAGPEKGRRLLFSAAISSVAPLHSQAQGQCQRACRCAQPCSPAVATGTRSFGNGPNRGEKICFLNAAWLDRPNFSLPEATHLPRERIFGACSAVRNAFADIGVRLAAPFGATLC